jgi:Na+-transporting NADH:ubiquinone oxidoreductase subunit B
MALRSLYVRGVWTADRAALAVIAAIMPPLILVLYEQGTALVFGLGIALGVSFFWQIVFAWSRGSPLGWDWVASAAAFIVLTPATTPLWQIGLAVTFGIVVGEQIFGGRGRGFLSPAAVALAFLFFSFPAAASVTAYGPIVLATLPGTLLLIFLGLISWRVLLAAFAGIAIAGILTGIDAPLAQLGSGGFVFGLVFLGCDPVSAAATNAGRILYGFLIGVLTVIFGGAEVSAIVFAILLASIFAPMIDYIVVWLHAYRRRHSFG